MWIHSRSSLSISVAKGWFFSRKALIFLVSVGCISNLTVLWVVLVEFLVLHNHFGVPLFRLGRSDTFLLYLRPFGWIQVLPVVVVIVQQLDLLSPRGLMFNYLVLSDIVRQSWLLSASSWTESCRGFVQRMFFSVGGWASYRGRFTKGADDAYSRIPTLSWACLLGLVVDSLDCWTLPSNHLIVVGLVCLQAW